MKRILFYAGLLLFSLGLSAQDKYLPVPDEYSHIPGPPESMLRINTALDSTVSYNYEGTSDSIPYMRYEFNYDSRRNLIIWSSYTWQEEFQVWFYSKKYEYEYDDSGNRIRFAYFLGIGDSEEWEELEREIW